MQIACEMPGCAEPLIGKIPICAKCKKRVPNKIISTLIKETSAGRFGQQYRFAMRDARKAILEAQHTIQESITEAEQELEKKLDELYPPMLVDLGDPHNCQIIPMLREAPLRKEWFIQNPQPEMFYEKDIKQEEKPMDAEAATQAYNWLAVYATMLTLILAAVLILVFAGAQK